METKLLARLIDATRTITPLVSISAAALDLPQAGPDTSVRAQVAARLPDGTFRVVIDGKSLKLALPAGIKPGDVLQLRIGNDGQAQPQTYAARASGGSSLSAAGQLIGALLGQPAAAPAHQARPILQLPAMPPAEMSEPLARAVERSGLFYESHQARWAGGDYPLERLLEEPQATMARKSAANERELRQPEFRQPERDHRAEPTPPILAEPADSIAEHGTQPAAAPTPTLAGDDARPELVARDALPLIRQQLDMLETRQFAWLGEIWPGQVMRWQIGEDHSSSADSDRQNDWSTQFALCLPTLGEVGAELALGREGVRVILSAGSAQTAESMQANAPALARALEAAGVSLAELKVRHGESAL